jgi:hypothetical protein
LAGSDSLVLLDGVEELVRNLATDEKGVTLEVDEA